MRVVFEFKDKYGAIKTENSKKLNLDQDQLSALLNAHEITYPYKIGETKVSKKAIIGNLNFDMYRDEHIHLHIELVEK